MERRVFFNHSDALHRILFLYGHTDDSFVVNGVLYNSMECMLESHLRQMGYDLVLFYNGVQRLYCFSDEMAEKRDRYYPEHRRQEDQNSKRINDEFAALSAILGEDAAENHEQRNASAPLIIHVDDLQISSLVDQIMRNNYVKSAIVFSDAWDLFEHTEPGALRTLSNRFRSWYHLNATNENVVILCFSSLSQAHLSEALRQNQSWGFLQEKMIRGNTFTDAVKYISIPRDDELKGRLQLEESYFSLKPAERAKVLIGVKQKLHDMGNSLKGLDSYLNVEPNPMGSLVSSLEDDSKALDTLHETRGWEAVAEAVDRIANTVSMAGTVEKIALPEGILERMSEGEAFIPAGICCNIVLKGNPGTGKTTIAKLLGRIFRHLNLLPSGHVVEAARDDLVGQYIGHTAVNTRAKIEEAMGGILFIDEAYSLYRQSDGPGSRDFGVEAIDTLIEAMTRSVGSFAVVLAGYPEEMEHMLDANPGFRSRFGQNIVNIEDYQPELLRDISCEYLSSQYQRTSLKFDPSLLQPSTTGNVPLDVFFRGWFSARNRKHFGNARDCRNLVDVLVDHALIRGGNTIKMEDFPQELAKYFKEADLDLDTVLKSLDDIVGQKAVKEKLLTIVKRLRLRNRQMAERPGTTMESAAPGHYLFCGNPGTGKSTIAEKFAQVLGALRITGRFVPTRVTGMMLIEAMQNRGIEGMRQIIENARGGVLFIDEAHQLINVPGALQLLLDPMIEYKNDLCVILACYARDKDSIFINEPGLKGRLSCEPFDFADYNKDELVEIFIKKVSSAGYSLTEDTLERATNWFNVRLMNDAESANGRYAERLLSIAEDNMSARLDLDDQTLDTNKLFEICPEDIPMDIFEDIV